MIESTRYWEFVEFLRRYCIVEEELEHYFDNRLLKIKQSVRLHCNLNVELVCQFLFTCPVLRLFSGGLVRFGLPTDE